MKTRIHGKGLGPLSSFSSLVKQSVQDTFKSSNENQLTEDERELLKQIKPVAYSSHTPRRSSWPANHN